jgi:hypothetical protein
MEFKIRDDIEIRSLSFRTTRIIQYTSEDIARYVSYFLDRINSITDHSKPIGVKFGLLSFVSTCCLLALVKSGRDYCIIYYKNDDFRENNDSKFSHVFKLGPFWEVQNESIGSVLEYETEGAEHAITTDLTFEFSSTQKVYVMADDVDTIELLTTTGKIEESSIKAAMANYFTEDDYCVFHRPMRHIGVATLCIYPALFKAKGISFCATRPEWATQVNLATHIHFGYDMIRDKWSLPKKLRMLTTGGYDFNQECVEYVRSKSDIDSIVDCYGTRFCPPPLAIRYLKISKHPIPFKWINDYIRPDVRENILYLIASDESNIFLNLQGDEVSYIRTMDTALTLDDDVIYLKLIPHNTDISVPATTTPALRLNNVIGDIRMHHMTYPDCDFIDYLSVNCDLSIKLAYHFDHGIFYPKLLVNANEVEQCVKYVADNDIEAIIYVKYDAPPE